MICKSKATGTVSDTTLFVATCILLLTKSKDLAKSFVMNKRLLNKPTLKAVAALAKVDPSTVSRVLAGRPEVRVGDETRERILRAAHELNYRPNSIARSLKTRRTFTIAMFVPDVGNPVFPEIIRGVEDAAGLAGYCVLLNHLSERAVKNGLHLQLLEENRVDGLLIATSKTKDAVIEELVARRSTFVLINRRTQVTNNFVGVDDTGGARIATEHLIALGHRNIVHLAGPLMLGTAVRRLQGYRLGLGDNGLDCRNELVEEADWFSWHSGKAAMRRVIHRAKGFTAVFAGNLLVGIGAIAALVEAGFRVPEDVSVICLHDAPIAEMYNPPLTVVKMPLYEMGFEGASALLRIIDGEDGGVPRVLAPGGLVSRGSTCPPNL